MRQKPACKSHPNTHIIRKKMLTASKFPAQAGVSENDYINGHFFAHFLNQINEL